MKQRCVYLLVLASLLVSSPAWCDRAWSRVTSPHFIILTDGSAKDAQEVASEHERFRLMLQSTFPGLRTDFAAPITVLAFRDESSLREFFPNSPGWVGGMSSTGSRDQKVIVVRLDALHRRVDTRYGVEQNLAYHEYVHAVEHINFHNLPAWLNEGTACLYSTFTTEGQRAEIGRPLKHYSMILRDGFKIPIRDLVTARGPLASGHDEVQVRQFYAESWGLVHYLLVGDNGAHAAQLAKFIDLLQHFTAPKVAAEQAFGNFDQLQRRVEEYFRNYQLPFRYFPIPAIAVEKQEAEVVTAAQVLAVKAACAAIFRQKTAGELVQAALQADPKSGLAYQTRGLLLLRQGRWQDAEKDFERAAALDPRLYLAIYYHAMLRAHQAQTPGELRAVEAELRQTISVNAGFARPYVYLSDLLIQRPEGMEEAVSLARKAADLEPARPGYLLHLARILIRAGKFADAQKTASLAQSAAEGAGEVGEAIDLLLRAQECSANPQCTRPRVSTYVPVPSRPAAESEESPASENTPKDSAQKNPVAIHGVEPAPDPDLPSTTGTIVSVECPKGIRSIQVRQGDTTRRFLTARFMILAPDTTWFDSGFANFCYFLPGARATVTYTDSQSAEPTASSIEVLEWGPPS